MKETVKKVQIKDLKVGDQIKTFCADTKSVVFKNVTDIWNTVVPAGDQVQLTFSNGAVVNCSINHPIMVLDDSGTLVEKKPKDLTMSDAVISDDIADSNVEYVYLASVKQQSNDPNYIDITVEDTHTFFVQDSIETPMILTHNSQGGVRGGAATLNVPLWHEEIEEILVLKNNKGTEDNRVRRLDYCVHFTRLMYERYIQDGEISLFSPHKVPALYEAFYADTPTFEKLYKQYENDPAIVARKVSARKLFHTFLTESVETGRMYYFNADHVNQHSSFNIPVYMTNLCLTGNSIVTVKLPNDVILDVELEEIGSLLLQYNGDVSVKSRCNDSEQEVFSKIEAFAKTHPTAEIITIEDIDSGYTIQCTPNHEVFTLNRGYVQADQLVETDQLCIVRS